MTEKSLPLVAGVSAAIIMGSTIGNVYCAEKRYNELFNSDKKIEDVNFDRIELHLESDTYDVEEEINKLNIVENDLLPYNTYKVLRYIDSNNYEKIAITRSYLNYNKDENNNINGYYYTLCDVFSNEVILNTYLYKHNEKLDLSDYRNEDIISVISYSDLDSLKEIAISKGMNELYVNSVMGDTKNKSQYTYDVARYYVSLVNSINRYNNGMKIVKQ